MSSGRHSGGVIPEHVLVVGAGVMGAATAYYLTRLSEEVRVTMVEGAGVAAAASGKAGGFLAKDWNDGGAVGALARKSFDLHQELARELDLKGSYRRLTCASVAIGDLPANRAPAQKKLEGVEWARGIASAPMGDETTVAQVHPKVLTEALVDAAVATGRASLVIGKCERATGSGATLDDGRELDADAVVVACGPWSGRVLPPPFTADDVLGVKYHAVCLRTPQEEVFSQAVFYQGGGDVEVYPRPDGDNYCCAFPDPAVTVTEEPGAVEVRDDAVQRIVDATRGASAVFRDASVSSASACHLPVVSRNGGAAPWIGAVPGHPGLWVITGHSCWGILNAPASGLALAQSLLSVAPCVDLSPFAPPPAV